MEENVFELLQGYKSADGVVHKEYVLREMDGSDEEAISKKEIKANGAKVLRTLLTRCCTRIGSICKDDIKPAEWTAIIQSLVAFDQDMMLLNLRRISLGEEIETEYDCPNPDCKEKISYTMGIDELEVIPYDGLEEIPFELPKGAKDKEGNLLRKGTIRRPNGLDREILDSVIRSNVGRANTLMLARCITNLEGKPVHDDLIRSLSVKDRNYLLDLLDQHKFGINMQVEIECPTCYETFKASLNAVNFI